MPDAEQLAQDLLRLVPLLDTWNVNLTGLDPGNSVALSMDVSPTIVGPYGQVLGGVLMTVADIAAGVCAATAWRTAGYAGTGRFATQEITIHFVRGAKTGPIRIEADVLKLSARRAVIAVSAHEG